MKPSKHKLSSNRSKYLKALLAAAPFLTTLPVTLADEAPEPFFAGGTLALAVDTHFVSYGADVWGAGKDWDDLLFHPMLELGFNLGGGFTGILGTWWDVNDNSAQPAEIGKSVQEVDIWGGVSYSMDDFTFTALYQEWMYGGESERIVDLKAAYSHFLNPSLTLHCRVDSGNAGQDDGVAAVLGIAPGKTFEEAGDLSITIPVNVAAETDGFHGGDSGWSFASIGASASIPLKFIAKGDWTLSAGVTYFLTNEDVIPGNVEENFLTGTTALTLSF